MRACHPANRLPRRQARPSRVDLPPVLSYYDFKSCAQGSAAMSQQNLPLADQLQRADHRICSMILNSDVEWIDVAIQIEQMRDLCLAQAPDKEDLFEAVYVSRFRRLWDQWHDDRPGQPGNHHEAQPSW